MDAKTKTVLIVEDNELNMKLFHDLLDAHDLHGSFCTKRIDRNWLGKELEHGEEETDAGADSDAASAD